MAKEAITTVSTLSAASIGNAKAARDLQPGDNQIITLGVIMGIARSLSQRANPHDPNKPTVALVGTFEGIPADSDRPKLIATRCFLPGTVHDNIVEILLSGRKLAAKAPPKDKPIDMPPVDGLQVPVMIEIGVQRAETAVGYKFVATILREPDDKIDPLRELRADLPKLTKAVSAAQAALPAPAATASKKKRR